MNNIPYGFLSPVLAQKKLLEFLRPSKQTDQNCAILQSNPCKDTMTNISTVPTLLRDEVVANPAEENNEALEELRGVLSRASVRAYHKELISERGQETIAKARRYNISFDEDEVDFLGLMDEISDYEYLLKMAKEVGVDWDESNYDIDVLQNAIDVAEHRNSYEERQQFRSDYYASVAV